jgi:hypothetical protein
VAARRARPAAGQGTDDRIFWSRLGEAIGLTVPEIFVLRADTVIE